MKKILLFFLIYSSGLIAQSPSVYSSFGIGELNVNPTARKSGFGIGIAQADPFDINPFNPAGNGKIQFVKFSGSLNYSINSYSDNKSKNKFQTGQFENLLIAFPIQRDYGVVFTGGITPFTRVKYKVLSPQNFFDSISYQTTYEGIGGITDYSAGLSYLIKNAGYIGLQVDFLIGTITRKLSTDFKNTDYTNPVFTSLNKFKGKTLRIGFISNNISSLFNDFAVRQLRVGFSYTFASSIQLERTDLKQGIFIDTVWESTERVYLPSQFAIGLDGKLSERLSIFVDFLSQDWTKLSTNLTSNYSPVNQNYISLGVEYLPSSRPEKFIEAVTYRMGVFYKDLGVAINNKKIDEVGIKTGLSIPIDKLNLIDFGFQYSIRGKKGNSMIKESVFNIWFGINFAEMWFVRNTE